MRHVDVDPEVVLALDDPLAEAALVVLGGRVRSFEVNSRIGSTAEEVIADNTSTTSVRQGYQGGAHVRARKILVCKQQTDRTCNLRRRRR